MGINLPRSLRPLLGLLTWVMIASACGGGDPGVTLADADADVDVDTETATVTQPETSPEPEATVEPASDDPVDTQPSDEAEDGGEPESETDPDVPTPGGGAAAPTPTQGPIEGEAAFTAASKLSTVGLDEIFFGDPVEFAAEVASTTWVGLAEEGSRPQCYTVQPAGGPAGIYFTILDGFVERVDISNPLITTRSGAGIGSSEQGLIDLFGDNLETIDIESGREIIFVPTDAEDRQFRIVWTTDGSAVVHMRAGRVPGIMTASPCG